MMGKLKNGRGTALSLRRVALPQIGRLGFN
jgi:hypothetical protein